MIVGTLRMPVSAERRADVLEVLRSVAGRTLAQPGCVGFHIYEEQSPETALVLVERWASEATFEAHIRSDAYRRILGALELSVGPPDVRFERVSGSEGMELVERLRGDVIPVNPTPG